MNKKIEFYGLLHELSLQYPKGVTTCGPCCNEGCTELSRGSGECRHCLEKEMAELLGDLELAKAIHSSVKSYRHLICVAELKLEEQK